MRYRSTPRSIHLGQLVPLAGLFTTAVAGTRAAVQMSPPSAASATLVSAQQPKALPPAVAALVFDHVTVVDVEHGMLHTDQRVLIAGNRIQKMGTGGAVTIPAGARVVEAGGKYLIPGLWDMHVHPARATATAYPLFIAYGITGIRDAGSPVPLDTLRLWRREILAGTRVGPPCQILSGQSIAGPIPKCTRGDPQRRASDQTCVTDSADAVHYVDSLKAAGADMIKQREVMTRALYIAIAAESRRVGLPFGGHVSYVTELDASDQGAMIIDHRWGDADCAFDATPLDNNTLLAFAATIPGADRLAPEDIIQTLREVGVVAPKDRGLQPGDPKLLACWQAAAARFRRNGTWFVPTLTSGHERHVLANFHFGVPLLAGTDAKAWGSALHKQLAFYVSQGLTPLEALQTATLNPAKMLHATDSLGTVAPGKLADLVLLDANPLTDIRNTRQIRAVVANGRYFDRAALDQLLATGQAKEQQELHPPGTAR